MLPSVLRQLLYRHNVALPSACGCGPVLTRRGLNNRSNIQFVVEPTTITRRWNSSSGDGKKAPTRYVVEPTTMTMQKLDPANYSADEIPPLVTSYNERGFTIQGKMSPCPSPLERPERGWIRTGFSNKWPKSENGQFFHPAVLGFLAIFSR